VGCKGADVFKVAEIKREEGHVFLPEGRVDGLRGGIGVVAGGDDDEAGGVLAGDGEGGLVANTRCTAP
jgi:hypothetical protein